MGKSSGATRTSTSQNPRGIASPVNLGGSNDNLIKVSSSGNKITLGDYNEFRVYGMTYHKGEVDRVEFVFHENIQNKVNQDGERYKFDDSSGTMVVYHKDGGRDSIMIAWNSGWEEPGGVKKMFEEHKNKYINEIRNSIR